MNDRPDDEHLVERRVASSTVYRGRFFELRLDHVALPGGAQATREYIVHPGAVMVVPLADDGRLVMERQFRYPVGRVMLEFPAGKLDRGESPFACVDARAGRGDRLYARPSGRAPASPSTSWRRATSTPR